MPSADLDANKDLVRRFTEGGNAADWDALAEVVTEDFARHSAATAGPPVTSREEFVELQREAEGSMRVDGDHHQFGLFPRATWTAAMREVGFEGRSRLDPWGRDVFVARRPRE